jgi:hypothetical protein
MKKSKLIMVVAVLVLVVWVVLSITKIINEIEL